MSNDKHIFTTSAGVEIPLVAIPVMQGQMVEQSARKAAAKLFGEPVKPTYVLETDDGGEETHEHDEETIKDDPAAKRAWDKWQECLRKTSEYVNTKLLDFALMEGTDAQLPESKAWMKRQRILGIEIPEEDPEDNCELRLHYTKSVLLGNPIDIANIQTAIMVISGINQEALEAARATFSRNAQERRDARDDDSPAGPEEVELDGESTILGDADGEGVASHTKRVGRARRHG